MKIVFIGTVNFSAKMLQKLIEMKSNIVGVCTKKQSDFNTDYADLTPICQAYQIPYRYTDDINAAENINWIRSLKPDVIFCFGWSSIIKSELLHLPPMGIIGYHPAKLPENRGRHPIIWAIALGLEQSASTFFFMDAGADTGDILSQVEFEILHEDDAALIYEKVTLCAMNQLEVFVPELEQNSFMRINQDHLLASTWRKRGQSDGIIDFRMNSLSIYNLVRSLTKPYVGAHISYQGKDVIIWRVEVVLFTKKNIEAGKVLAVEGNTILVKTYDGAISLLEHEFEILPVKGDYL